MPQIVPGTLNVEITECYAELGIKEYDEFLEAKDYNGKEYVKIKRCKVNGYSSAIVRPKEHFEFEKFRRRIEVMSSVKLRDQLNLVDGTEVTLQFDGDDAWWRGQPSVNSTTNDRT